MITYQILAGSTDVSVVIRIVDSTDGTPETGVVFNTAGIDLQYRRELAASTAITEATLAALTTAHTDGGFLHIGNGYYRLDLPDAAVAAGAAGVLIHGVVTGMVVIGCYIQLEALVNSVYTRVGAPAGASVSADVAAIKAETATILSDTNDIQTRIPAALVSGRIDASVGAMAANVLTATAINADAFTAAKFAADVTTELQSGLATAAELAKVPKSDGTATWNATALAAIQSEANDALVAYDPPTNAELVSEINAVQVDIAALNNLSAAQVNTEVDTALADIRLDELLAADSDIDGVAPPTVGSVFHELMTKTAGSFTYDQTTDSLEAVRDNMGTAQTGDAFARLGAPAGASVSADVAAVKSDSAAILVDTGTTLDARIPAALVGGRMDSSTGAMAADVITAAALAADAGSEIATAVGALTIAELAADPGATPAMKDALMLLYMAVRNKRDTTSSTDEIHNNAGTVILTATVSDDAITFSKTKYA